MFNDGRAVSESSCVELRGLNRAGLYGIQLNDDELRVRFIHLGVSATRVPWEYGIFREGKRTSLGRLTSADRVFPKSVTFEMAIGPEKP